MKYYMKVCIYVDELLYACLCWIKHDDYMMLQLNDEYLWDYYIEFVRCVDVVVKSLMLYVVVE